MLFRLFLRLFRSYVGGPSRSWVFTALATALFNFVRSSVGRQELIDLSSIKPGQKIVIEHLDVSHKKQIKDEKQDKRQQKKLAKQDKQYLSERRRSRRSRTDA